MRGLHRRASLTRAGPRAPGLGVDRSRRSHRPRQERGDRRQGGAGALLEGHHRRENRDTALALDRHPVRAHPPPLALRPDLARQLDRPAEQQKLLRSVWSCRRRDRKGAPARNLVGQGTHQSASAVGFSCWQERAISSERFPLCQRRTGIC
jgi:hypothetical protein